MKISEQWLKEWVNPALTRKEIAEKLTMTGIEVESISPVCEQFSNVIIGQVLEIEKHPQADRLKVCLVNTGTEQLTIVCGANNVKKGLKVAVALENAILPAELEIKKSSIRGVTSFGMLCSANELGIPDESKGILELPDDAELGLPIWDYLNLSDHIMDLSVTPNRGDCLSIKGIARELSVVTNTPMTPISEKKIAPGHSATLPILIQSTEACPRYAGRIIKGVKADNKTPIWMQERLRRSAIRSISAVVDVMNYVMLELGQPMHAFDLNKIGKEIHVRYATLQEELYLLDGNTVTLQSDTLVIADEKKPHAIAGVMGGMDSGVSLLTQDIFLESAYFSSETIAKTARYFNLNSDSSYRFERGIDPTLQITALERATELLLNIVGGEPGPIIEQVTQRYLPAPKTILLRFDNIKKLLGISIPKEDIKTILSGLGFKHSNLTEQCEVIVPPWRHDVTIEEDLIEEIGRLYGYEKIPTQLPTALLRFPETSDQSISSQKLKEKLSSLGFQEIISYSFIDSTLQQLFDPNIEPKKLLNPITQDMSVMRTSLWPSLISTLIYNQNRQQLRARLFEMGLQFKVVNNILEQKPVISGLINGIYCPEQWGVPAREVDFFDLKGDLETFFQLLDPHSSIEFKAATHHALHPNQTAACYKNNEFIGIVGGLHPSLAKKLDIQSSTFLFELLQEPLCLTQLPRAKNISKLPEIRRDIAILIDKAIPSQEIRDTILNVAGEILQEVKVFDVYESNGMTNSKKSIALSLTLQHSSRTLIDDEVATLMDRVIAALKDNFTAELRG